MSEQQYKHLTHEDTIQAGDEFWTGSAWFEYHEDCIGRFVHIDPSRRPIANAIDQSQRERIAYEELRPGDVIQPGDQWWPKDGTGQWQAYDQGMFGLQVLDASIARRPIRATHQTTFEEVPGSRTLQQAVDQPQRERWAYEELQPGDVIQEGDEWQHENGRWKPFTSLVGSCVQVRHTQRARRPYRVSAILEIGDALADAQKAATQLQNERDEAQAARKSAQRARDELQRQVDELRDLVNELHGSVDEIADAGTAADVKEMLCTWATELDYSSDCFDAVGKSQLDIVQKTLITAIARIEIEFGKEGTSADT